MSYTYDISAKAMFEDRFEEFVSLGIPRAEVTEMQHAITDMWADTPGGWVYEWSALARRHTEAGEMFLASLAYGCAKFPCLANEARRVALSKQVETYLAAAPGFPMKFERRLIDVPYGAATVTVPTHIYSATGEYGSRPVLSSTAASTPGRWTCMGSASRWHNILTLQLSRSTNPGPARIRPR